MAAHTGPNGETLYHKQPQVYGRSPAESTLDDLREIQRRQRAWIEAGCPVPRRTFWQRVRDWFRDLA